MMTKSEWVGQLEMERDKGVCGEGENKCESVRGTFLNENHSCFHLHLIFKSM